MTPQPCTGSQQRSSRAAGAGTHQCSACLVGSDVDDHLPDAKGELAADDKGDKGVAWALDAPVGARLACPRHLLGVVVGLARILALVGAALRRQVPGAHLPHECRAVEAVHAGGQQREEKGVQLVVVCLVCRGAARRRRRALLCACGRRLLFGIGNRLRTAPQRVRQVVRLRLGRQLVVRGQQRGLELGEGDVAVLVAVELVEEGADLLVAQRLERWVGSRHGGGVCLSRRWRVSAAVHTQPAASLYSPAASRMPSFAESGCGELLLLLLRKRAASAAACGWRACAWRRARASTISQHVGAAPLTAAQWAGARDLALWPLIRQPAARRTGADPAAAPQAAACGLASQRRHRTGCGTASTSRAPPSGAACG
jgi:hypothetical protein